LQVVRRAQLVLMGNMLQVLDQVQHLLALQLPVLKTIYVSVEQERFARLEKKQLLLALQFAQLAPTLNTAAAVVLVLEQHARQEVTALEVLSTNALLENIQLDHFQYVRTAMMGNGLLLNPLRVLHALPLIVVLDTSAIEDIEVHVPMGNIVLQAPDTGISV